MNSEQQNILQIANIITTGLSILGELFMIISYLKFSHKATYAMKLVNALVVSDLLYSSANILSIFPQDLPSICVTEGFLRQVGADSAAFWVVVISYSTYKQATNFDKSREKSFGKLTCLICFFSLLLAAVYVN